MTVFGARRLTVHPLLSRCAEGGCLVALRMKAFSHKADIGRWRAGAGRMLRSAVLWRKGSFGPNSGEGRLFVERMLTAVDAPAPGALRARLRGGGHPRPHPRSAETLPAP